MNKTARLIALLLAALALGLGLAGCAGAPIESATPVSPNGCSQTNAAGRCVAWEFGPSRKQADEFNKQKAAREYWQGQPAQGATP